MRAGTPWVAVAFLLLRQKLAASAALVTSQPDSFVMHARTGWSVRFTGDALC